ncbi:MAG: hypothetical protein WC632_02840 [Candidatus Margulisiibacteriota bacterium]
MPKKIVVACSLLALVTTLGFVIFGCGANSDTTTTTTTAPTVTIASAQVSAAKAGVLLASGGSSVGSSATTVGSAAGVKLMSVRALGGPPASFFTSLTTGTASIDGYLSPTSESVGGNMTPYMRLKTVGGDIVNGAFLANKKIGKWLTLEVEDIMGGTEGVIPNGMTVEVSSYVARYVAAYIAGANTHPFTNTTIFRPISTEADYMAWMFMYPSIEAGISTMAQFMPGAPSHIYMITPEVTNLDKIGGMEMKMVFSKSATGEITISVNTGPEGRPVAGIYSGASTLTTPAGSLEATMSMNFTADGPPSWLRVVGTTEAAPKYTVIVNMNPATMTATGEVLDSSGTRIGTLEGSSTGGNVYIGGSKEAFAL